MPELRGGAILETWSVYLMCVNDHQVVVLGEVETLLQMKLPALTTLSVRTPRRCAATLAFSEEEFTERGCCRFQPLANRPKTITKALITCV
jgi:hypothetical protein